MNPGMMWWWQSRFVISGMWQGPPWPIPAYILMHIPLKMQNAVSNNFCSSLLIQSYLILAEVVWSISNIFKRMQTYVFYVFLCSIPGKIKSQPKTISFYTVYINEITDHGNKYRVLTVFLVLSIKMHKLGQGRTKKNSHFQTIFTSFVSLCFTWTGFKHLTKQQSVLFARRIFEPNHYDI